LSFPDWLVANPQVQVHFTSASASWMNMVELGFGIIERQAVHHGSFASVTDLNRRIRAFIDGWNERAHPFVWTKTADQILAEANRKKTSDAPHSVSLPRGSNSYEGSKHHQVRPGTQEAMVGGPQC
jgi:hypothetical protein